MQDLKNFIAARVAKELKDGDVVNLGIGLPTLVPNHLGADVNLILQSENGFVGLGDLQQRVRRIWILPTQAESPQESFREVLFLTARLHF